MASTPPLDIAVNQVETLEFAADRFGRPHRLARIGDGSGRDVAAAVVELCRRVDLTRGDTFVVHPRGQAWSGRTADLFVMVEHECQPSEWCRRAPPSITAWAEPLLVEIAEVAMWILDRLPQARLSVEIGAHTAFGLDFRAVMPAMAADLEQVDALREMMARLERPACASAHALLEARTRVRLTPIATSIAS